VAVLPPRFRDCVVAIGVEAGQEKKRTWIATGFFYGHIVEDQDNRGLYSTYLVTNRHVLEKKYRVVIRCNPQTHEEAREYSLELLDAAGQPKWLAHSDSHIDVAALPFNYGELCDQGMKVAFFRNNSSIADKVRIRDLMVSEGDGVYVLGFPMGLVGPVRNTVVVRNGTIASIRGLLEEDTNAFLIDAFIFPGNSGGPVVLRPELGAITGTKSHPKSLLLGIVTGYIPYSEPAVSPQTGKTRVVFVENSGLAAVHPVDCIDQVIASHIKAMPPLPEDVAQRMLAPDENGAT